MPTPAHPVARHQRLAGMAVLGLVGSLVVIRGRITSPHQGSGPALSAAGGCPVFYILVVSPTYGLVSAARLWAILTLSFSRRLQRRAA